jgi:hypothetical protein
MTTTKNPMLSEEMKFYYTDWLRKYPECWTADGGIDGLRLLQHVTSMVGVHSLLKLHQLINDGEVPMRYFDNVERVCSELLRVIELAAAGSKFAENQLIVIEKVLNPNTYNVPDSVIENIAERYHSSPHVARGSYLRYVMYFLKRIVAPSSAGKPLTTRSRVQLVDAAESNYPYLFKKARQHWNKNSTLQSLAIQIFLSEVNATSSTSANIDERTLKRDLAILRKWEVSHRRSSGDAIAGDVLEEYGTEDEPITWPVFSVNPKWSWYPKNGLV